MVAFSKRAISGSMINHVHDGASLCQCRIREQGPSARTEEALGLRVYMAEELRAQTHDEDEWNKTPGYDYASDYLLLRQYCMLAEMHQLHQKVNFSSLNTWISATLSWALSSAAVCTPVSIILTLPPCAMWCTSSSIISI